MTCDECNVPLAPGEQWPQGESGHLCGGCAESIQRASAEPVPWELLADVFGDKKEVPCG